MPRTPTYEELLALVTQLASQIKDGDVDPETGDEYLADGNDEEVDALYGFISDARDLLGTDGSDLPVAPRPITE